LSLKFFILNYSHYLKFDHSIYVFVSIILFNNVISQFLFSKDAKGNEWYIYSDNLIYYSFDINFGLLAKSYFNIKF